MRPGRSYSPRTLVLGIDGEKIRPAKPDVSLGGRYEHYSDVGQVFMPQFGVTLAPGHGFTFRGALGRLRNIQTLKTNWFDLTTRYRQRTRLGVFKYGLESTYVLRYAQADTPTSPISDVRIRRGSSFAALLNGICAGCGLPPSSTSRPATTILQPIGR
jgi:hypothetical protein